MALEADKPPEYDVDVNAGITDNEAAHDAAVADKKADNAHKDEDALREAEAPLQHISLRPKVEPISGMLNPPGGKSFLGLRPCVPPAPGAAGREEGASGDRAGDIRRKPSWSAGPTS